MRFLYRKSLFKNGFDQNFFICQPIFKFFAAKFLIADWANSSSKLSVASRANQCHGNSCWPIGIATYGNGVLEKR